ncbi:DNA translocase FtsK 4TM domain-containing protein [Chitinophagaceae bacterium LB-8]|uniref:DNA translocase FtsK 4TM domain-containing protein n=1 Tax=Paraflavisolibacter caeni TaxID=2982496 RepID=A0A9X2XX04_9BACT|nr:DNA translocase FtsK 4TM domain-containing protein [Paraflavisolibacter caeni]MCU7550826.1 DNA translocase FtsK 4TM domain-containing protein [Paraflavisolibacter caeni]
MANKLKKPVPPKVEEKEVKKAKPDPEKLKQDREEKVDFKQLAKDERTWKIMGTVSLLLSVFLFIAFISYLFTWKEDQDKVLNNEASFLWDDEIKVSNLLGRLGAYISHFFIYRGFGIASLLFCSFFFITGINLLTNQKIFSVKRNLRYITFGLLITSVSFSFLFSSAAFPFGGRVGDMISSWLNSFLGIAGTAALLLVVGLSYIIWQFNPTFRLPEKPIKPVKVEEEVDDEVLTVDQDYSKAQPEMAPVSDAKLFVEEDVKPVVPEKGNILKGDGEMIVNIPVQETPKNVFELVEKNIPEEERLIINQTVEEPEPLIEEQELDEVEPLTYNETERTHFSSMESGNESEHDDAIPTLVLQTPVVHVERPRFPSAATDLKLEINRVEDKPIDEEREKDYSDLPPYEPTLDLRDYKYPSLDILESHGSEKIVQDASELEMHKNQIITTLKNYDITIQRISATVGPTVTLYEIVPAAGVRISRIKNLEDDIALSLAALGIRIIAPIPGKGTIGIEVPNVKKTVVSMRTLLSSEKFQHNTFSLPIAIGKKIDNDNFIVDLAAMPHLLMAGATGQGKSVGLNAILVSLLYKKHPSQLKLVLIDPKKVELSIYRHIEKHFLAKLPGEEEAIITDTKKVINTLNALCIEMDNRYDLLKEAGARNIKEYNDKFIKRRLNPQKGHQYLPFIVLVVDEFADLIMTAGKEVEMPIARLAQLARAVGIHLIIATQRPSVNIITGTIKANFPARIAFKVSSKIDSRTILDAGGAEQLIGKGDMLISYNGEIVRLQCAFVDTPEVEEVVDSIARQRGYSQAFMLPEYVDEKELESKDFDVADRDPLFEEAARLIVQNQVGSTSLIQRRMKLGYNRAGRLMDQLEAAGVVGPNLGSKAREVMIKTEAELLEYLENMP